MNKESTDDSWDQVPRANRGMVGRWARERNRGGRGRRVPPERGVWSEVRGCGC
jgi:hypothetical protein